MKPLVTLALLCCSNIFMTFAWYWNLKKNSFLNDKPLFIIILLSWCIAFFEYCLVIPANRFGLASGMNLAQLKIAQEAITICVFIPFAVYFMGERWKMDYVWAFLCILGAVFFVNREHLMR